MTEINVDERFKKLEEQLKIEIDKRQELEKNVTKKSDVSISKDETESKAVYTKRQDDRLKEIYSNPNSQDRHHVTSFFNAIEQYIAATAKSTLKSVQSTDISFGLTQDVDEISVFLSNMLDKWKKNFGGK